MRAFLCRQGQELRQTWRSGLSGDVMQVSAAFFVLVLVFYAACMALPTLREGLVGQLLKILGDLGAVQEDGAISASLLFVSNLNACSLMMLYGLIPFLRLPALTLGLNAMMLGTLAAWYATQGISPLVYLALLLPHGLLELPAMALSLAVGLYTCRQLTRRLRGHREGTLPLAECILLQARTALFAVTPLLAAAAWLEAYVTPRLVAWLF